ncbi:MAG: hypothetical protein OXG36_13350 [Caldilineaceae bacterium]|nr:hypothetical protein [Caldilineaceae bacterium]
MTTEERFTAIETRLGRLEEGHAQAVAALTAIDGSLDTLFNEIGETRKLVELMSQTLESLDSSYARMATEVQTMKRTIQQVRRG